MFIVRVVEILGEFIGLFVTGIGTTIVALIWLRVELKEMRRNGKKFYTFEEIIESLMPYRALQMPIPLLLAGIILTTISIIVMFK